MPGSVLCQGGSRGPWLTVKRERVFSLKEHVVCGKNYRMGKGSADFLEGARWSLF